MSLPATPSAIESPPAKKEISKHASSPSKTPISMLQEWCQKLGKTPQYDLTAMEGRAHQPQFVYRCTVGDISLSGQGGSKKSAKHAAAEAVLSCLKSGGDTSELGDEQPPPPPISVAPKTIVNEDSTNPVGTLQELVVARGWRLPSYTLYADSGPAHKKEFIMCCTVESFKELGSGTAKKHAKRSAAMKMYNKIQSLPPDAEPRVDTENKKGKPVEFDVLYNSVGEVINFKTLYMDNISDVSSIQALKKIGDHCNFSCEFFDISEQTETGTYQCMAMLLTQPSLVVHGEGISFDEAHNHAAKNAIRMLIIFAQRSRQKEQMEGEVSLGHSVSCI